MAELVINKSWSFDSSKRRFVLPYTVELAQGETYQQMQIITSSDWCKVVSGTTTSYQTEIELSENTGVETREASITVMAVTSSGNTIVTVYVTQDRFKIYPIWATQTIQYETRLNKVKYEVKVGDETIYGGMAYLKPNADFVEIDISKICASYLNSSMEGIFDNPQNYNAIDGVKQFSVWINGVMHGSYLFFNSYTYKVEDEYLREGHNVLLSDPIRKVIDRRQYVVLSFFEPFKDTEYSKTIALTANNGMALMPITATLRGRQLYTTLIKIPDNKLDKVSCDGMTIDIKDTNCKYCLYYQNALGGWDSFLINGNDKQTDKITSYKYVKSVDTTTKHFGTKKYLNSITSTYKLFTDWLTDDEASRMHHLLESTEVYLHNLEDDTIIPVNLTNSNCEYKTFTNNGRKKFNYTIECEFAQPKIRQ